MDAGALSPSCKAGVGRWWPPCLLLPVLGLPVEKREKNRYNGFIGARIAVRVILISGMAASAVTHMDGRLCPARTD